MGLLAQISDPNLGRLEGPVPAWEPAAGTGVDAFRNPFLNILNNIIGFITLLAGLMFLIILLSAGLAWVTSGGDKSKVESARNQMTNAAIGLIVVVAAYGITGVIGRVLGLDILNPIDIIQTLAPGGGTP